MLRGRPIFYYQFGIGGFFGDGGYAVTGRYSAEAWSAGLRAGGRAFDWRAGNLDKVVRRPGPSRAA
jgi:hypothetical protein